MNIKLAIIFLLLGVFAYAESLNCQIKILKISLNSNNPNTCQSLNIEGQYKINLCDNDQGKLVGDDGSERYLFKSDNTWLARQDILDYTNNISITEIVQINNTLTDFFLTKTTSKRDGTILQNFKCVGSLKILAE